MSRRRRRYHDAEINFWLGYTDLLSNSLFLLLLTVSVTAVARSFNDKPPMLSLTEKESFRFPTGSYTLTTTFKAALHRRISEIRESIKDYRINVIEVIGHTDGLPNGQPENPAISNLDLLLPSGNFTQPLGQFRVGSNSDLGLLRAIAVAQELRKSLDPDGRQNLIFRPYSAASLIDAKGQWRPAASTDQEARRRIEVRLTRSERISRGQN